MKKYLLKGLAVCTFLCTVIAFPSLAKVCFVPSDICDEEARPAESDAMTCDKLRSEGNLYYEKQEGKNCRVYPNSIPGCVLYECYDHLNCQAQGYTEGPTENSDTYPLRFKKIYYTCEWCLQGSDYWWQCRERTCPQGQTVKSNAQCPDGQEWAEWDAEGEEVVTTIKGKCGKCVEKECPEGYSASKPESGCFKCDVQYLDTAKTKACYKCHRMNEDYITETEKEELGEGCYTYKEEPTDVDPVCYLKGEVTCGDDQYSMTTTLDNGKQKCSCEDCAYEFTADEIMHYTAAGGSKDNNVISTRICGAESTENWDKWHPMSSTVIGCDIKKEDGALTVTCQPNTTPDEKKGTFVLRQIKKDGATISKEITVTVIIDPDTCANPEPAAVAAGGCNTPGAVNFSKGPNPRCYETKLASQISCQDGEIKLESPAKSVANQSCFYCVKNTCPEGYTLGETPEPVDGYDVAKTDADNNCYMIKQCPEGFSTEYQSDQDCGTHPEGWIFEANGMSGDKVCGKCTPKVCSGADFDHKCEAQPRCVNEADNSCGYKDLNKKDPDSIEYEGDTPKYNCNDKECPAGTSIEQTEGCGTNVPTEYRSGENICYQYKDPDPCPEDHIRTDDCRCVCNKTCGPDFELDAESCTCKPLCTPGDGFFGSACCKDTDCKSSDEFPLYCFKNGTELQGRCYECNTVEDCAFTDKPGDKFFTKYGAGVTKYPGYKKNDNNEYEYEGDRGKPDYTDRDKCTGGECILKEPERPKCYKGDGTFGSACCEDADCGNGDEFQLYCFHAPAMGDDYEILKDQNGNVLSEFSCRECGAYSDCGLFEQDMSRFEAKCEAKPGNCEKLGNQTYVYEDVDGRKTRIKKYNFEYTTGKYNAVAVYVNHHREGNGDMANEASWKRSSNKTTIHGYTGNEDRVSCRFGECATYAATYEYNAEKAEKNRKTFIEDFHYSEAEAQEAIDARYALYNSIQAVGGKHSDDNDKCPAGSTKEYPKGCSADEAVAVGHTPFGSFCWACPEK